MKKSLISLLVLLMTAVSGAWAQETVLNHSANNTWAIAEMPGYDVELEVEYFNITAPTANLAVIYAGSTTPLIYAGSTGEDAIMMYLVTATNEQPTSTDGFRAAVPTAEGLTAGTYYVWYYLYFPSGDDSDISALAVEVTVIAAPYCAISMKKGTLDADNWQGKAGEGEYQALPLEGVALGTAVSVKYNGTKKVKSVKAKAATALNLTSPAVGQVIGDDGKNYDYACLPGDVTAVAKICYVSGSNGLALALTDEEGFMNWNTAKTTCAAHTPAFTGGTWKLPSKDDWNNMITAAGGYTALRDGFSSVGGSNLQSMGYWSSTEYEYDPGYEVLYPYAWSCHFNNGDWGGELRDFPMCRARACLAFWGSPAVGQVIGNDGKNYDYANLPDGVTAVAKICYVSGSNGLALALTDEGTMNWVTATSTCPAHRPAIPGGTWKLATKDEWSNMITAAGGYEALRDGFSSIGGSNLQSASYLSSTYETGDAWIYDFGSCSCNWGSAYAFHYYRVRACLAFGALAPDPIKLTKNTDGETWTLASMPDYHVELEVTYYTYAITVKEGTEDATSWQGKAGEGNYQALPFTGLEAGTAVSVKYNGTKKVKSVKAKKKAAAYTMAAAATSADKGKLICTDGHIHAYGEDAECTEDRVAKIIYIGSTGHDTYTHGLALALTDEDVMVWGDAIDACSAKNTSTPVTDATWLLASREQLGYMMGTNGAGSSSALRTGFMSVGGYDLQQDGYWSSTESNSDRGVLFDFGYPALNDDLKGNYYRVRACLAFGAQDPNPIDLTPSADGTVWTLSTMPEYDVELEVEYETALALSETTDNSAALTEWNGYEADVTLTRTLQAGSYNTFAAPFSTAIPSGWTVKQLTSATFADGTLTLNFATAASIEAGKPYLVKVTANTDLSTAPFTGAIVSKDAQPFTSTDVDFIPTLGATTIPAGDTKAVLFLAAGNKLLNPSALPANMKGFRAYFQLKGEAASLARAFSIDFGDGETTGIMAIGTDRAASTDNATYTLDGRRISKATQKGVYIQNGKKVIIK